MPAAKTKGRPAVAGSVAETIRRRREGLGLSQEEVAEQLGLTADFVGLCEKGKRWIGLDRIPKLAEILEVNAKELAVTALSEEAPELAEVILHGKLSVDYQIPSLGKAEQGTFLRLMALDRNQREPILATINALYDLHQEKKSRMKKGDAR